MTCWDVDLGPCSDVLFDDSSLSGILMELYLL